MVLILAVLYGCKDGVQNGYVSEHSIIADIPLMGKQQQRMLYSAYGKLDAEGQYGQVLILSDFTQDGDGLSEEQAYIAGIYNGEILTYYMGKCWPKSIAEMCIRDRACVGGCIGGAGCLTHGEKNKAEVDKYGKEALEKTITDAISVLKD